MEKKLSEKKFVGKTIFVRKINCKKKNYWKKNLSEKKIIGNFFYQKVVGVASVT